MNEIRVGLIGWGSAATTFHAPLLRATPGLRLAAVATRSPDAARASVHAACGADVAVVTPQTLIADPSLALVVVATPNASHHALADAALAAGHHVVVDKPFTLALGQAQALAERAAALGRQLCVFHNRRWDGDFMTLRALLADGVIGRPVEFVSHFDRFRPQVRERWRERAGPGAGLWFDLGPHLLDQALQLFDMPAAIELDLARQRDGAQVDDWFCCRLRWDHGPFGGLRARLQAGMLAAKPGPRFLVHGTEGSLEIEGLDPQEAALKQGDDPAAADWGHDDTRCARLWRRADDVQTLPLQAGAYPLFYAAVRDAVQGGSALPVAMDGALAVQRLLDAGLESAARGQPRHLA
ncbi:oxidoreductase [Rubrivivax gelatinosus]|uniref:oxidoreductase n=1 Tax=Rubrivivax gelatinosus TaxID=28068 RepID=UPI0002EE2AFF|nr:oxidoreductase [Rubrivivax gelatinosus]MBG6078902.1 putative dehydrogenase [Rubrivivax gelatinosus]